MNYALPLVSQKSAAQARARPLMVPCARPVTAPPAANEEAPVHPATLRPVDPMLLVFQERVETFRLLAAALRRGARTLAGLFVA
jgi:hypothetical protein